jgi:hypothetical protein
MPGAVTEPGRLRLHAEDTLALTELSDELAQSRFGEPLREHRGRADRAFVTQNLAGAGQREGAPPWADVAADADGAILTAAPTDVRSSRRDGRSGQPRGGPRSASAGSPTWVSSTGSPPSEGSTVTLQSSRRCRTTGSAASTPHRVAAARLPSPSD